MKLQKPCTETTHRHTHTRSCLQRQTADLHYTHLLSAAIYMQTEREGLRLGLKPLSHTGDSEQSRQEDRETGTFGEAPRAGVGIRGRGLQGKIRYGERRERKRESSKGGGGKEKPREKTEAEVKAEASTNQLHGGTLVYRVRGSKRQLVWSAFST